MVLLPSCLGGWQTLIMQHIIKEGHVVIKGPGIITVTNPKAHALTPLPRYPSQTTSAGDTLKRLGREAPVPGRHAVCVWQRTPRTKGRGLRAAKLCRGSTLTSMGPFFLPEASFLLMMRPRIMLHVHNTPYQKSLEKCPFVCIFFTQ